MIINSPWSSPRPSDYLLLHEGPPTWGSKATAFFAICSHRVWRGGPRSALQISAVLFTLLALFYVLPAHLQVADGYLRVLSWSSSTPDEPNNLRIVVFGSQDVFGSAANAKHDAVTWPEHLCKELHCSELVSMIPAVDSQPAITSNALYSKEITALQYLNEQADIVTSPASDNFFIPEQYPVPNEALDLEAQVDKFLAMPLPKVAPRETLWVFTFGTWDIWNVAALARPAGQALIDSFVVHIFEQIELLYRKSLNPKSVAFSDFWSNVTTDEIQLLTQPDAINKVDKKKLESFRILIPQLFDISLTPGWQSRPLPSMPSSRGVQLRNAVYLTERWNSQVSKKMEDWRRKENAKPEGDEDDEDVDVVPVEVPTMDALLEYLPETLRPKRKHQNETENVVYAPYPLRAGWQPYTNAPILDAMTEEEMRRSGLKDGRGRGTMAYGAPMRFLDIWTPCTPSDRPIVGVVGLNETTTMMEACVKPDDHLFHDSFTLSQRASRELAKQAAAVAKEQLFPEPEL